MSMQSTLSKQDMTAWRDLITPPQQAHAVFTAILCFLSCLVLPLSDHPTVSMIFLLACAAYYYALTHSLRSLLLFVAPLALLYAVSILFPAIPNPLLLPCAAATLLLGGSTGAFLLTHYYDLRRYWFLPALPVAAWGAAALITGDPIRGLLTLLPLVPAIVGAYCILHCTPRTESTVRIAAALGAALALAGVITLAAMNALRGESITALADYLRGAVIAFFHEARALYAEAGMDLALSEVDISNTAAMLVNILPGLFCAACAIIGFLLWRLLITLLAAYGSIRRCPLRLAAFTMSRTSAVLFVVSYVASLIANTGGVTPFGTVCQNLSIVLEPGLAYIGFVSLLTTGRSCLSHILAFSLIFVTFSYPGVGLAIAALLGAFRILAARFLPHPNDKGEK